MLHSYTSHTQTYSIREADIAAIVFIGVGEIIRDMHGNGYTADYHRCKNQKDVYMLVRENGLLYECLREEWLEYGADIVKSDTNPLGVDPTILAQARGNQFILIPLHGPLVLYWTGNQRERRVLAVKKKKQPRKPTKR